MYPLLRFVSTYWIAITALLLAIITALSLYPMDKLPPVPGSDKTHHLIAYAALMFPAALRKPSYWLIVAAFFVCWSGGIELIQPYVNRYGEWLDMAANTAGVVCGLFIAQIIRFFASDNGKLS
ncbi:MAG: VanZ family protein [Motiliproteus sp.]|nr:VanZ family protein [Motiliproteus sp.]MCW9052072.1 VanZ family protein [Motiliproteus sp.]